MSHFRPAVSTVEPTAPGRFLVCFLVFLCLVSLFGFFCLVSFVFCRLFFFFLCVFFCLFFVCLVFWLGFFVCGFKVCSFGCGSFGFFTGFLFLLFSCLGVVVFRLLLAMSCLPFSVSVCMWCVFFWGVF